jgi:hypothetical protein
MKAFALIGKGIATKARDENAERALRSPEATSRPSKAFWTKCRDFGKLREISARFLQGNAEELDKPLRASVRNVHHLWFERGLGSADKHEWAESMRFRLSGFSRQARKDTIAQRERADT